MGQVYLQTIKMSHVLVTTVQHCTVFAMLLEVPSPKPPYP
jgi:hypothetical protein